MALTNEQRQLAETIKAELLAGASDLNEAPTASLSDVDYIAGFNSDKTPRKIPASALRDGADTAIALVEELEKETEQKIRGVENGFLRGDEMTKEELQQKIDAEVDRIDTNISFLVDEIADAGKATEGVVDLGVVTSSTVAFSKAAEKSITENVKVRQIRWRTSDSNADGGQGAGGTIFQERYGNWHISQWMMFEGPNRVCKVRTITTGGNYQVSEWQNVVIPQNLTYDPTQRMIRSVGPYAPGQGVTTGPTTDLLHLPLADEDHAGLMSNEDKVKLDGIGDHAFRFSVVRISGFGLPSGVDSVYCSSNTENEKPWNLMPEGIFFDPDSCRLYALVRGDAVMGGGPLQYFYTKYYKWSGPETADYRASNYGAVGSDGFVTPYPDRLYLTESGEMYVYDGADMVPFCRLPSSSFIGENVKIGDNVTISGDNLEIVTREYSDGSVRFLLDYKRQDGKLARAEFADGSIIRQGCELNASVQTYNGGRFRFKQSSGTVNVSYLGAGSSIGEGVTVGNNVTIPDNFTGKDYRIGDGSAIGRRVSISDNVRIDVSPDTEEIYLWDSTEMGIGPWFRAGRGSYVGRRAHVGDGVSIDGAFYPMNGGQITFCYDDGCGNFITSAIGEGVEIGKNVRIPDGWTPPTAPMSFIQCRIVETPYGGTPPELHLTGAEPLVEAGYVPYIFRNSRKRNRYKNLPSGESTAPNVKGWNLLGCDRALKLEGTKVLFLVAERKFWGAHSSMPIGASYSPLVTDLVEVKTDEEGAQYVSWGKRKVLLEDRRGTTGKNRMLRLPFAIGFAPPGLASTTEVINNLVTPLATFSVRVNSNGWNNVVFSR